MSAIRVAVMGAAGRMGQELVRAVKGSEACTLAAAFERPGSIALGGDAGLLAGVGKLGVLISDDPKAALASVDAVLDFTTPDASAALAAIAAELGVAHVIGTTGLGDAHEQAILAASRRTAIVKAGNMSLGVNLLTALTRKIAQALDADFDIEIVEMHHKHKVHAPSGTALMLGRAAAEGRGIDFKTRSVMTRAGHTGERPRGAIGFATLRGGNVVGEHTVVFAGEGERIEISHRATDRGIFARGAVKAAIWAKGKTPGLYAMTDVLGI